MNAEGLDIDWEATGSMVGGIGAWAQMLAVVLSIWAAFLIGQRQSREAANEREREFQTFLETVRQLAEAAAMLATHVRVNLRKGIVTEREIEILTLATALERFDATRLRSAAKALAVVGMVTALRDTSQLLRQVNADLMRGQPTAPDVWEAIEEQIVRIKRAHETLDR